MVLAAELPIQFWLFHDPDGIPGADPEKACSVPYTFKLNPFRFNFSPAFVSALMNKLFTSSLPVRVTV